MKQAFHDSAALRWVAGISTLLIAGIIILALFGPRLEYKILAPGTDKLASEEFMRELEAITDARIQRNNKVDVLVNGENFYPEALKAIRAAKKSVTLEAYIFYGDSVGKEFVEALAERARNGVRVNLVADAVGSMSTDYEFFKPITDAGGRVAWYHPVRWHNWIRSNNRTHREILVVDGEIAFIGGAGFADHWLKPDKEHPRWRDNMVRIEGDAVPNLQGTLVENWLEASGEVLSEGEYFNFDPNPPGVPVLVVESSPTSGSSTRARILFQVLLASARQKLYIATPYFLPDDSVREEMIKAKRDRGVDIKILLPSEKIDHKITRASSRGLWGDLLANGIEIYEYQPSMMHAKVLVVDGTWSVVGSTNFDNRSFGLNDELNTAIRDTATATRLMSDLDKDFAQARRITYEEWKNRSYFARGLEWIGWLVERQQ